MLSSPLVEILGSASYKVKLPREPFLRSHGAPTVSLPASVDYSHPLPNPAGGGGLEPSPRQYCGDQSLDRESILG